jgi:NAD(P)H-hydrate epimerase
VPGAHHSGKPAAGPDPALVQRFGAFTATEVAALDAAAVDLGVDILQLMEVAGLQVARAAWQLCGELPARVLVVAGRGNNGGDGLVAARMLDAWGCRVRALLVGDAERLSPAAAAQLRALRSTAVAHTSSARAGDVRSDAVGVDLVIDALLGTGLRGAPRDDDAAVIGAIRGRRVLAVDIPSGLDASTGMAAGACVRATDTCTLTAMKTGLWAPGAGEFCGNLTVADIGMPSGAWHRAGLRRPDDVVAGALLPVPTAT